MKLNILIILLLLLPLVQAGSYGSETYSSEVYGPIHDLDEDGITDEEDPLLYNESQVTTTGLTELNITINDEDTSGNFNGEKEIKFYDQSDLLVNFSHNFDDSTLDLSQVTITKTTTEIIINLSGQLQTDYNKTIYIDDNDFVSLCAKDAEIEEIGEMTSDCSAPDETDLTDCLSNSAELNGLTCIDLGTTISINNLNYSAIRGTPLSSIQTDTVTPTGSGGGTEREVPKEECSRDLHCAPNQYCYGNKCLDYECVFNTDCNYEIGENCYENKCVKLFDIKIIEFTSELKLGEFFNFTYYLKGMAQIESDVEISFKIERDGTLITSGLDTIYMGSYEEKTETTNLFLPQDMAPGFYELTIEVDSGSYTARTSRTIELEITKKSAKFFLLPDFKILGKYILYFIIFASIVTLGYVFNHERKKIKKSLVSEKRWVRKHKWFASLAITFILLEYLIYVFKINEWMGPLVYKVFRSYTSLIPSPWSYLFVIFLVSGIFLEFFIRWISKVYKRLYPKEKK